MFLLCLAAFLGSGLAAALAWPVLGVWAVIIAPFGGSIATSVVAILVASSANITHRAQVQEPEYREYA
jgi:ABC-type dipeptide/oligopeptide/nickel transport system permease subunit